MSIEIIKERHFKAGYTIQYRQLLSDAAGDGPPVVIKSAVTPEGHYIGDSGRAYQLIVKRGIKPEKVASNHSVCSVGFSEREQRWYGWSHRAIYGFKMGDTFKVSDPDGVVTTSTLATLEDCKREAVAFAASVS